MADKNDELMQGLLSNLTPEALTQLVEKMVKERTSEINRSRAPEYRERLMKAYTLLLDLHKFSEGDVVKWKPALKNKRLPDYDVPMVVVETIDPPIRDANENAGSQYFREYLNVVVGFLDEDELVLVHMDGRRLEPVEAVAIEADQP